MYRMWSHLQVLSPPCRLVVDFTVARTGCGVQRKVFLQYPLHGLNDVLPRRLLLGRYELGDANADHDLNKLEPGGKGEGGSERETTITCIGVRAVERLCFICHL